MMMRAMAWAVMVLAGAALASAGDDCTEIAAVPYTISAPGRYCFQSSLEYSVWGGLAAVAIDSDDVELDLQGHVLDGARSDSLATGILAFGRQNVIVRNGTVRGFGRAVLLDALPERSEKGYAVADVRLEEAGASGLKVDGYGVLDATEDAVFKTTQCTHPHHDGVQCNVKTCRGDAASDCSEFASACINSGHHYSGTSDGGTCTRVL